MASVFFLSPAETIAAVHVVMGALCSNSIRTVHKCLYENTIFRANNKSSAVGDGKEVMVAQLFEDVVRFLYIVSKLACSRHFRSEDRSEGLDD